MRGNARSGFSYGGKGCFAGACVGYDEQGPNGQGGWAVGAGYPAGAEFGGQLVLFNVNPFKP